MSSPSPGGPPRNQEPATTNQGPAPDSSSFYRWIRDLGIARTQDRWVGGVAGGIARRTGLDLALVRGLIVVLVIFGGVGVLLYGIAWALLPEPDGRIHVEQAGRGSWTTGLTGATVLVALGLLRPGLPVLGDGGSDLLWALFWIGAVVLVVYWIINRSGGDTPPPGMRGQDARPQAHDDAVPGDEPVGPQDDLVPTHAPPYRPYQPGQSPWAGSSFSYAGDSYQQPLPAREPMTPPRALRPSGSTTALLIGGSLILAALVLALDYTGVLGLTDPLVVGLAAGTTVLALGIIGLGVRGRSSGLVGFTAALAIVGALVASFTPVGGTWAMAQESTVRPTTPGVAAGGYGSIAADTTIDLTELPQLSEDLLVPVDSLVSDVTVLVPQDVPVEVRGRMPLGSVDTRSTGSDAAARTFEGGVLDVDRDELTPGATGPAIILELGGALSDVTVVTVVTETDDPERTDPAPIDPAPTDPAPTGDTP
ncbi:PspC domain-containing protein [Arthrobacter echini]|nr:PspC domain-containing protein [Arthrobacter echini]